MIQWQKLSIFHVEGVALVGYNQVIIDAEAYLRTQGVQICEEFGPECAYRNCILMLTAFAGTHCEGCSLSSE